MIVGVAVPNRVDVAAFVQAAERLGFDGCWFPDHLGVPPDVPNLRPPYLEALSACLWGLGATTRLRFGTDVLVAPYRPPLHVRAAAGTAARLAPGRFVLGVGTGYLRREFLAVGAGPYELRGRRTEELLRALKEPPDGVVTLDPEVPVWMGGHGASARARAARWADGWHPLWLSPEAYAAGRREIEDAIGGSRPFTFSYSAASGPVPELAYAPPPLVHPGGRPWFTGTVDDVAGDLHALGEAGVEHVLLRPHDLDHLHALAEVARAVA